MCNKHNCVVPHVQGVEGDGNALGWAARDTSGVLAPYKFTRRSMGPKDVFIKITHAGMLSQFASQPAIR